jgi:hypothetical protein
MKEEEVRVLKEKGLARRDSAEDLSKDELVKKEGKVSLLRRSAGCTSHGTGRRGTGTGLCESRFTLPDLLHATSRWSLYECSYCIAICVCREL